jgi:hypothetical protein
VIQGPQAGGQLAQSAMVRCDATLLTRALPIERWITTVLAQSRTVSPAPTDQNWRPTSRCSPMVAPPGSARADL